MIDKQGFWRVPQTATAELRKFGLIMAVAATTIALFLWYKNWTETVFWVGLVAAVFGAASVGLPSVLRPLYVSWMLFARILGFVNSHVLLTLVFYTLFTVIGALMRLLRHDPLDRRLEKDRYSYWNKRDPSQPSRDHFERQV